MIVRVLGSAAGGGVPQWNCSCVNCAAARRGDAPPRSQSSFALSADGDAWWLVNVSPDVAAQIEAFPPLQPRERRGTPIAGMLLTDANVDHLGGLAVVRQSHPRGFEVYSSEIVRTIATAQPAFAAFARPPHRWHSVLTEPFALDGGALRVTPFPVPGLTPGFAGRDQARGAVLAFRVESTTSGRSILFAPVFAAIDPELAAAIDAADVVLLDGSFWSEDEMRDAGLGEKTARGLGHLPLEGASGSLRAIADRRNRRIYVHLNNSNPVLDPASPQARAVLAAGAEIAFDGMDILRL
ncbi:MAG: pyrroloquinoline quinone biosynthesis protein PqqB [Candidatus Eremiobacteraeota bacterium]|nr:pyrroloquinoline quinone biosynthesis protein PqqB [Candidatus Eremiobacteraeota bacterium]